MKMRLLLVSLALSLLLVALVPGTAVATRTVWLQPFGALGTFYAIDDGDVSPLGDSGYWLVRNRHLWGALTEGPINGAFTITYGAIVDMEQAGGFFSNLVMDDGSYSMAVAGTSDPAVYVGDTPEGYPIYILHISGWWSFTSGAYGAGNFSGDLAFIPTPDGHIAFVIPNMSDIEITGKWRP